MKVNHVALVTCFLALASLLPARDQRPNLIVNGSLEGHTQNGLPPGWRTHVLGIPAQIAIDTDEKREGEQSIRVSATETARSYVQSEPIPVAPGETIRASAWVRVKDVPADRGTVILIGDFSRADDTGHRAEKFAVATIKGPDGPVEDWQKVEGALTVPPGMAQLRVRMGFSYSRGTCWWDDVRVEAEQQLVAQSDLSELRPAMQSIPVTLINRAQEQTQVLVRVALDDQSWQTPIDLTGQPVQQIEVPVEIEKRGRMTLRASLSRADEELFVETRQVTVPPAIVLPPVIPTHWVIEDGEARAEGVIELAVKDSIRDGAKLRVELIDEVGEVLAHWTHPEDVTDGATAFELRAPGVGLGDYKLVAKLVPREGAVLRAEQPWHVIPRRLAKVTLNDAGYPEYDGRAIFPLGMFNGGARMKEKGAAGFTVSHAYNAVRVFPGERPFDQRAKDFLDNSAQHGMKALFMVPMRLAEEGDWDGFRRRIRMFRNHPALLAWDQEEGIARGDMTWETLEKIRQILLEEDPHHPFMVGDSREPIQRMEDRSNFFPDEVMDMGMWWWYPFPIGSVRTDGALEGEEVVRHNELAPPTFLTLRTTTKPLWVGVQSYKKPGPTARYPAPVEYRAQAYLAVIHGAKGLMWYGGSVTGGLFHSPDEGNWEYLKTLVTELRELSDIFMAPEKPPPTLDPSDAMISVTIRRAGERTVMIAANRSDQPVDVTLRSPMIPAGALRVIGEDRVIDAGEGELSDRFDRYDVHVYEWR